MEMTKNQVPAVPASPREADEDSTAFQVVINHEEQYSIWPDDKGAPPLGWSCVGVKGPKRDCLEHINAVWTDMRPLSLRLRMAERAAEGNRDAGGNRGVSPPASVDADPRDDLVAFLASGRHPVEAGLRPEKTLTHFLAALERGYVHLRFLDTRGVTELGLRLDAASCDFEGADLDSGSGTLHIEGTLTLNGEAVRCISDLDLSTLSGEGWLRKEAGTGPE